MKLTIIIPVYNEEKTIAKVIDQLKKVDIGKIHKEIIVVDDGSTDKTISKINKRGIKLVELKKNKGKGNAIREGIKKATGDFITIQDADLEYDPKYFRFLMEPIVFGDATAVYGTRLKRLPNREIEKTNRMLFHFLANRALSLLTSILFLTWLTDVETCYKIFPAGLFKKYKLRSDDFMIEVEITAKLLKSGNRIMELPISAHPRDYKEGKKFKTLRDGSGAFIGILKFRFID